MKMKIRVNYPLHLIYVISRTGNTSKADEAKRIVREKLPFCVPAVYRLRRNPQIVTLAVYCPKDYVVPDSIVYEIGRRIEELRKIADGEAVDTSLDIMWREAQKLLPRLLEPEDAIDKVVSWSISHKPSNVAKMLVKAYKAGILGSIEQAETLLKKIAVGKTPRIPSDIMIQVSFSDMMDVLDEIYKSLYKKAYQNDKALLKLLMSPLIDTGYGGDKGKKLERGLKALSSISPVLPRLLMSSYVEMMNGDFEKAEWIPLMLRAIARSRDKEAYIPICPGRYDVVAVAYYLLLNA